MAELMQPTVGRIVHWFEKKNKKAGPIAAVVTGVDSDSETNDVHLSILFTDGIVFALFIPHIKSAGASDDGYWDWPEKV